MIPEPPRKSCCQSAGTRSAGLQRGELDAEREDDDADKQVAPPDFTRVGYDETNRGETIFTLLNG